MSNYKILQHLHGLTFHINYEKPELVHSSLESSELTFSDKDYDFHIQETSLRLRVTSSQGTKPLLLLAVSTHIYTNMVLFPNNWQNTAVCPHISIVINFMQLYYH